MSKGDLIQQVAGNAYENVDKGTAGQVPIVNPTEDGHEYKTIVDVTEQNPVNLSYLNGDGTQEGDERFRYDAGFVYLESIQGGEWIISNTFSASIETDNVSIWKGFGGLTAKTEDAAWLTLQEFYNLIGKAAGPLTHIVGDSRVKNVLMGGIDDESKVYKLHHEDYEVFTIGSPTDTIATDSPYVVGAESPELQGYYTHDIPFDPEDLLTPGCNGLHWYGLGLNDDYTPDPGNVNPPDPTVYAQFNGSQYTYDVTDPLPVESVQVTGGDTRLGLDKKYGELGFETASAFDITVLQERCVKERKVYASLEETNHKNGGGGFSQQGVFENAKDAEGISGNFNGEQCLACGRLYLTRSISEKSFKIGGDGTTASFNIRVAPYILRVVATEEYVDEKVDNDVKSAIVSPDEQTKAEAYDGERFDVTMNGKDRTVIDNQKVEVWSYDEDSKFILTDTEFSFYKNILTTPVKVFTVDLTKFQYNDGTGAKDVTFKQKVLELDNTTSYTPVGDYNPATKKFVQDLIAMCAGFKGVYADITALETAHPTSNAGSTATVTSPNGNLFYWNDGAGEWQDTGTGYIGDMLKFIFDPTGVNSDAFSMDNMTETPVAKVFSDTERTKLSGIESGAEVNQNDAEIKTQYENNANTNAFTDTEKTNLGNQSGTNTGDQDLSGLQPILAEGQFVDGDKTKLDGIESGAEVNQTDSEIKTQYENNSDTNAFTDAEKTNLGNQSGTNTGDQDLSGKQDILSEGAFVDGDKTKLDNQSGTNTGDQDLSGLQPILAEGQFVDGDKTKLDGIESGAEVNQTDSEIKTQYENNSDTNAFTDAEKTNLGNQSGTNTGDQDLSGKQDILSEGAFVDGDKTKLDNQSGTNTGDQDLSGLALKSNVLELNNTDPFTPDADYEPATKKYVDDIKQQIVFDANNVIYYYNHEIASANSTSTGDPVIDFDDTTLETVVCGSKVTPNYDDGNVTIEIDWLGNTSGSVAWGVEFMSQSNIINDTYATQIIEVDSTSATANDINTTAFTVTKAQADVITANSKFKMRFERVANDAGDNMVGDARVLAITLRF